MATKYEVIEVSAHITGNHLHASMKPVAICTTPQLAQSTLVALATEAYNQAVTNPMLIKAYMVRPIDILLPGFE